MDRSTSAEDGHNVWSSATYVVLDNVFSYLSFADLIEVRLVCRNWYKHARLSLLKWDKFAVSASSFKWEPITYFTSLFFSHLAQCESHASCYHPLTNKVYVFGGRVPSANGMATAAFNDLFSFDMLTKRWQRVFVCSGPFPTPKCDCSMVVWKDCLIVFGGCRTGPRSQFEYNVIAETHIFDVVTNTWRLVTSIDRGRVLSKMETTQPGLCRHAAAIYTKYMVVIGGAACTDLQMNQEIFLFDLELASWFTPPLKSEPIPASHLFRGSLSLVRPGLFVYYAIGAVGEDTELGGDHLVYFLVHFDPDDVFAPWTIEKKQAESELSGKVLCMPGPVATTALNGKVTLTMLAMSKRSSRSLTRSRLEQLRKRSSLVKELLMERIKLDSKAFVDSLESAPCVLDCSPLSIAISVSSSKSCNYDVRIETNDGSELSLAEVDFLSCFVTSLLPIDVGGQPKRITSHRGSEGYKMCENILLMRRDMEKRSVVVLTADVSRPDDHVVWKQAESCMEGPLAVHYWSLTSARGTILMHGGGFNYEVENDSIASPASGTFILHPIK